MASRIDRTQPAPDLAIGPRSRAGLGRIGLTARERRILLVVVDLLLLNGALLAAVTLWNDFSPSWPVVLDHWKWFVTLTGVWLIVGVVLDAYSLARAASATNIIAAAAAAAALSSFAYLAIPWLTPPILTRSYAFGFVLLATGCLTAWRVLYARALSQPGFHHRALVLHVGEASPLLIEALQQGVAAGDANPFRGTGYQIVGIVSDRTAGGATPVRGVPTLGSVSELVHLARRYAVDEIILALGDGSSLSPEVHEVLLDSLELGLSLSRLSEVYERQTGRLPVEYAQDDLHLLLGPADTLAQRLYAAAKRAMDIALALVGLWALGCVTPAVAVLNALFSSGPLFYRQQRVGKGGQSFAVTKFRSMVPNAEAGTGAVWCEERDPRVTFVGQMLRRTRLDELPQVINVLRGEMSIVGPRPERPRFVGQLGRVIPLYRARHAVKPGLTGWAQVHYRYGNSVEDARIKLEYDLYYVKHASLFLDLLTVLHTVRTVLGLKGQ
jgi:exopolysaccharide biosynthesis polyprenyl glycosylphosphotransferase